MEKSAKSVIIKAPRIPAANPKPIIFLFLIKEIEKIDLRITITKIIKPRNINGKIIEESGLSHPKINVTIREHMIIDIPNNNEEILIHFNLLFFPTITKPYR